MLRFTSLYFIDLLFLSGDTCVTRRFCSISSVLVFSGVAYGLVLEWAELFLLLVFLLELKCDDVELERSIFGSLLSTLRFSIY